MDAPGRQASGQTTRKHLSQRFTGQVSGRKGLTSPCGCGWVEKSRFAALVPEGALVARFRHNGEAPLLVADDSRGPGNTSGAVSGWSPIR